MTDSSATLTSFWLDEGQASPVKNTPSKSSNSGDVNDDILKYYKDSGLEPLAKEAGLLNTNGELTGFKSPNSNPKKVLLVQNYKILSPVIQDRQGVGAPMVAIPLTSAATAPTRISPFKNEPAILPKVVHMTSSPMILGTPQRLISSPQLINSPRTPQNMISGVLDQTGSWSEVRKRTHDYSDADFSDSKRSKKGDKGGKGLRHFSMKVCEKVQRKGTTSYNEVADELVAEFSDPHRTMSPTDQAYDQKNIRRRVYDALNVLMAMNIISKEKKEIKWLGLPTNSAQECQNLELEKQRRLDRIRHKTQQLQELILQQIAFRNLVLRNKQLEISHGPPTPNSAIHLPFIIVNTSKKTVIDCSISNDKFEYLFNFDNTFEIHDDVEVLKRMGMAFGLEKGQCKPDDLEKSRQMVPKALESYVLQLFQGNSGNQKPSNKLKSPGSPLATPLSHDLTDHEVAMATCRGRTLSRQSSVGSFSDLAPSRADTGTPSEYSESESARSSPVES